MIELKQAEKLYGHSKVQRQKQKKGFQKMDLVIPDGQVVGILGENGAGKSTLLRTMAGILPLTGGKILFDGQPVQQHYEELAYVCGEGSYFPYMTPKEYMEFLDGVFPGFDGKRYKRLLKFFELEENQVIGKMSTGQRAKLEVAAGMAKHARYLLMDEPFLGKDMFTRRDFLKLMAGSLRGEETILIASHYVEEIGPFLDRVVILHQGKLAGDAMQDELREQGKTLVGFLQEATGYDRDKYRTLFDSES